MPARSEIVDNVPVLLVDFAVDGIARGLELLGDNGKNA
jgi:hypothetical protein